MRIGIIWAIGSLSVLLYHAEAQAEIIAKRHTEIIETNRHVYQIEMAGYQDGTNSRSPLGYAPFTVGFEPNKSLEIENIGNSTIVNPRLIINGERNWGSIEEILACVISDSMTVDEQVRAIFEFCKTNAFHFPVADRDGVDPVKVFNVYGYGTCQQMTGVLAALLFRIGVEVYKINLPGHTVNSVYYDNAYHLLDADRRVYYLAPDNKTIASVEQLIEDHYLIKRSHIYGVSALADKSKGELEASIYRGMASTKYYLNSMFKRAKLHRLDYSLRPGEKIIFNWHNEGKYHGRKKPNPWTWRLICNGKLVYKPHINLEGMRTEGSLTYEIKNPYVIVGGRLKASLDQKAPGDVCHIYFSYDQKNWAKLPFKPQSGRFSIDLNMDNFFPPTLNPAAYRYYIKFELADGKHSNDVTIEEIIFTTDIQMGYLSLPALSLGTNRLVYTDETPGPHKSKITHTWEENYANHPPEPPQAPVYPVDNSQVANLPVEFIWQPAADEDDDNIIDYRFQLSNRQDMRWPLSANFDQLISHTPTKGTPAYKIPFVGLLNSGEKYYWRVKAEDETGLWSKWSEVWSFIPSGPGLPQKVRLKKEAGAQALVWEPNSAGEAADFFEVYGSNEKGFTPSKTEYDIIFSTHYDRNKRRRHKLKKFPPNFIGAVNNPRFIVFDPNNPQSTEPYAYYRVAAVGEDGSRSGYSEPIKIDRPFIYSKPIHNPPSDAPYKYHLKSVYSIEYLEALAIGRRYTASYGGQDNLKFSLLLAPDWLSIKKTNARTALIYGTPPKHKPNGSSWVIALVNDASMNFDIQAFKIQGSYKNSYFKFSKGLLRFMLKYLKTKSGSKIRVLKAKLKRIYWNVHTGMPLNH